MKREVIYPEQLEGIKCEMDINKTGAAYHFEHADKGNLGGGFISEIPDKRILFRIYVSESIARDLITELYLLPCDPISPLGALLGLEVTPQDSFTMRITVSRFILTKPGDRGRLIWFDVLGLGL
jgi:hypothetical protein